MILARTPGSGTVTIMRTTEATVISAATIVVRIAALT